jgi:hypothetical protein
MKHPSWCDEDDCESGWHTISASYSNDALAKIEVRLAKATDDGTFELDLGRGDGAFNSNKSERDVQWEINQLKEFRDRLTLLIKAFESK